VLATAGLDQVVKHLVDSRLALHERVDLLPFLSLLRAHNTGIAFSLFSEFGGAVLIAVMIVVMLFIAWLATRTDPRQRLARTGFALVIGGALGNLIDRISLGHVVDYILFHVGSWSFAIFNLADAFITIGAGLVLLDEALGWWRSRRAGAGKADGS
jgi:signal peptidase II